VGDLVALVDPARAGLILVKRVVAIDGGVLEVAGDNAAASRDSRVFGPVAEAAVLGRAVYRYHPSDRAGRLPRRPPADPGRAAEV
jgi:hypothetical protein